MRHCHTDSDGFIQKDENSHGSLADMENSKQTSNRRKEKHDQHALERFDTDSIDIPGVRCEINNKLLKQRLYEKEIRLKNEIHKKEILLQEKLLKAVETLRNVQIGSAPEDKMKEEQRTMWKKPENRLYYTKKGNWDCEGARDMTLGGKTHEGQQEEFSNLFKGKDGIKRVDNHVKDMNVIQNEKRNTQRTRKTTELELDYFEKMTRDKRNSERIEKHMTKRERAVDWQGNEFKTREQSHWTEKDRVRAYDGEKKRRERAMLGKDTEKQDFDQHWNIMDKITSNSPFIGKGVFNHDKRDVRIKNHLVTQDRVHEYNHRAAEEIPIKQPLPEYGPRLQNIKSLQQEKFIAESSSDIDFQLQPCDVCHRKFKVDRLAAHISICQKIQKPKSKVYDSSKHRIKGTEIEEFMKKNPLSKTPELKKRLVGCAAAARGFQPRDDPYSDYVTCPHCSRRFAPGPAETHIPKCQNIKSKPPRLRQRNQI